MTWGSWRERSLNVYVRLCISGRVSVEFLRFLRRFSNPTTVKSHAREELPGYSLGLDLAPNLAFCS